MVAKTVNERVAKYHTTPKGRLTHLMCNVRQRAKKWDVPCDIDGAYLLELYIEQDGKCPISGQSFELSNRNGVKNVLPNAMSVDRIESSKGYVKGNVRILSIIANYCRGRWTDEEVYTFCNQVMENKK